METARQRSSRLPSSKIRHRGLSVSFRLLFLAGLIAHGAFAGAHESTALQDEAAISALTVGYAQATDEIGNGDVAAGKLKYAKCFTDDAKFEALFPNRDIQKRSDPNAWADFVLSAFQGAGYTTTQHLVGTIDVTVTGDNATMMSEVHATHVLPDGGMDIANGKYTDTVIRTTNAWRISERKLKLITFLNVPPGKPKVGGE